MCGMKSQASKIIFSNNFTFSRYDLFSSFNTCNTLGLHLSCGLWKTFHWEYHKIPDFKHETGRAGSWQPEFWNSLFPLPVSWICSRYVKPSQLLATNQLISISVFFSKQKCELAFKKVFWVTWPYRPPGNRKQAKPTQASQGTCDLTQMAKAMNLIGLFQ